MTAHTPAHAFTRAPDEYDRRPGDEVHPFAKDYGPDWRRVLKIKDHPHAEHDESAFYDFFGRVPFDAAPDLTARSVAGMTGRGL